jgi:hypothetical protein
LPMVHRHRCGGMTVGLEEGTQVMNSAYRVQKSVVTWIG